MAKNRFTRVRLAALTLALAGALAAAPLAAADGQGEPMSAADLQKAKGVVTVVSLGSDMSLELRKGYVFLPAGEAPPILQKLNIAPPAAPIIGAVAPEGLKPGDKGYWISVITEDPIGHVPETGADEIASLEFLDSVKKARPASPALVSFAVTPAYAPPTKQLIWAEKYESKPPTPNLKHEERLLGRVAVAGVTTSGNVAAQKKIEKAGKDVLAMISFTPGNTYADFIDATDRKSDYDLPGLITGKRKAGPMADEAPPAPAAGPAMSLADFAPGGKMQLVTYLGGAIAALGAGYMLISALRRRPYDDNVTPHDEDVRAAPPPPPRAAPPPPPPPSRSADDLPDDTDGDRA